MTSLKLRGFAMHASGPEPIAALPGATGALPMDRHRDPHYPVASVRTLLVLLIICCCLGANTARSIVDLNGNGMSDIWELIYGSGLDPNADLDGTGMTNLQKSIAGLNPWDPSSVFTASIASISGSTVELTWPSVLGKQYQIEGTASLTTGTWFSIGSPLAGTGTVMTGTIPQCVAANFFSVSVSDIFTSSDGQLSNWEALQLGLDPNNSYSSGTVSPNAAPLTNYNYVVAMLQAVNAVSITATTPTASIPQSNPATSPGSITITRTGNLNPITVSLVVSGSAVAGKDYATLPATCTLPLGVNSVTIPVVPLAGSNAPPATPIVVSLQPSAAYQVGTSGSATILLYPGPSTIPSLAWTPRSDWINVKNAPYNAYGDGIHDDTSAIQAALNAASANYQVPLTVYFPPGTYHISSQLTWNTSSSWVGMDGLTMIGCGSGTTLLWTGTTASPMFLSNGVGRCRYLGLTWNGAGLATSAFDFNSTTISESHMRIENNAFLNFTGAAITSYGGGNGTYEPASEVMVWNSLFQNCAIGIIIGSNLSNNYDWTIEGDEFLSCGIGIDVPKGESAIFDDQFEGSTQYDILTNPGEAERVRQCTSIGSAVFFATSNGIQRATNAQVVQDCHIDSWKSTAGAIQLGNPGPDQVSDCVFTNPPNGNPPIVMSCSASYPGLLLESGNYSPSLSQLVKSGTTFFVDTVPCGSLGSNLASPRTSFLKTTWPADSTQIIDVTQAPYSADTTGKADATATIQSAINAAEAANNGSIVYLPSGLYKISSTLTVTGSNYSVQGSGFCSQVLWYGPVGGTMMAVDTPQNIAIQQLQFKPTTGDLTTVALKETSSGPANLLLSGIYFYSYAPNNPWPRAWDEEGIGVELQDLPSNSVTYLEHVSAPIVINDCGPATILGNFIDFGRLIVNGSTNAKTGFTGIDYYLINANTSGYDILVDDNQDLAIGDCYEEAGYNHLHANRGAGTWTGRVSVQGIKQESNTSSAMIQVDNYAGRVYYGPTWDDNPFAMTINQTGTNAVDLVLPGLYWYTTPAVLSVTSACNFIQLQNYIQDASNNRTLMPDVLPTGWGASAAQGLDHLRQLAALDLQLRFGIGNVVLNPCSSLDPVNPNPLASPGYNPAGWQVINSLSNATGVRNVTTVSGASPFGPGSQSMSVVDTTNSTDGAPLEYLQNPTPLGASQSGVFSFDFNINSASTATDFWLYVLSGSNACCSVHLTATANGNQISALINGLDTPLAPVTSNTWYRVHVAIPPPANGLAQATLYLTPWTTSGPGAMQSFSIDGVPVASTTGLGEVYMNETMPGENLQVNLDNITMASGDPLPLPY